MTYRPHSGETSQMTKMGVQVKYEKQQKKIFEYYKQLLKFLKIKDDNLEEKSQVNSLLHESIIIHELKEEPIIKTNGYSMVFEDVPQSENNHNQNDDNLTFNQTSNSSIFFESLKGQRKPSNIYYEMPNNDEDNNSEEKYSKKRNMKKKSITRLITTSKLFLMTQKTLANILTKEMLNLKDKYNMTKKITG